MKIGTKRAMFRNCWWIAPLVGLAMTTLLWCATDDHGTLVVSMLAAVLSTVFFVQQQKLAELQVFKQLFVEFNKRYDDLNETLQRVAQRGVIADEDRFAIIDYFNLCAEEHLFFEEGYIDERVWKSLTNGMRAYFGTPAIRDLWLRESASDSFYGFQPPGIE